MEHHEEDFPLIAYTPHRYPCRSSILPDKLWSSPPQLRRRSPLMLASWQPLRWLSGRRWGVISARLDTIDKTLVKLVEVQQRLVEVEEGLQFTSESLNSLAAEVLPAISNHMAQIAESLAHQTLQIDVHRRKWNIIIHGIEGPAGELEHATRAKSIQFAQEVLKVEDAASWHLAACHRLSQRANAGIILRFLDLAQRDRWLTGTKNLRGHPRKISISPDLPPILGPLKDNLMLSRSKLAPGITSKSQVRYLPRWPFVELKVEGQAQKRARRIAIWHNKANSRFWSYL